MKVSFYVASTEYRNARNLFDRKEKFPFESSSSNSPLPSIVFTFTFFKYIYIHSDYRVVDLRSVLQE